MKKLFELNENLIIILFLLLDVICTGLGMGVPIFNIILGFLIGWYITKRVATVSTPTPFSKILKWSFWTSFFTFLQMLVIWGGSITMLFDPTTNYQNYGHPFILYDPKISFIAWLVLMILISPFLQFLTTILAAFVTLMKNEHKK